MVARLRCDVSWLAKDCIPCNTVRQRRRNLWERETEARDVETILICLAKRVDEVWRKEKHGDKLCDSTTSGVKKERRVQSGPAARTQRKNREENLNRFRSLLLFVHHSFQVLHVSQKQAWQSVPFEGGSLENSYLAFNEIHCTSEKLHLLKSFLSQNPNFKRI